MSPLHKKNLENVFNGESGKVVVGENIQEFLRWLSPMIQLKDGEDALDEQNEVTKVIDGYDGLEIIEKICTAKDVKLLTLLVDGCGISGVKSCANQMTGFLKEMGEKIENCKYNVVTLMMHDEPPGTLSLVDWSNQLEIINDTLPKECENIGYMWINDAGEMCKGKVRIDVLLIW